MGCLPYDITVKFYSWVAVIIYIAILSVLFLIKMKGVSKEIKSQRSIYRSIVFFLWFYICVRIFFLFSDFERDANCESLLYFQFVFLGYICSIAAFLNLIYFGETYIIKKSKHAFTIVIIISVIADLLVVIFLPNLVDMQLAAKYGSSYSQSQYEATVIEVASLIRLFNYIVQYFTMGIILLLYLYLITKTTGDIRKNSIITLIGLIIASIAAFLETDALLSSGMIPPYLSPIIISVGLTIFAISYLKTM